MGPGWLRLARPSYQSTAPTRTQTRNSRGREARAGARSWTGTAQGARRCRVRHDARRGVASPASSMVGMGALLGSPRALGDAPGRASPVGPDPGLVHPAVREQPLVPVSPARAPGPALVLVELRRAVAGSDARASRPGDPPRRSRRARPPAQGRRLSASLLGPAPSGAGPP